MPRHLTNELHLFSLDDLVRVKKKLLVPLLKDILKASLAHVAGCEVRVHLELVCPPSCPFHLRTCGGCSTCHPF